MMGHILLVWGSLALMLCSSFAFDGGLQFFPREDHYLIAGSLLQINCTLVRNGSSQFDINEVYIKKGTRVVDEAYITRYEDTNTVSMTVSHVSLNDSGRYFCYYGNGQIQSLTKVEVAESPGQPTNISCLSDALINLKCWFNLTVPTSLPMRWHMEYRLEASPQLSVNCSLILKTVVTCDTVPDNSLSAFYPHPYEVYVEGLNDEFSLNISKLFIVYYNYSIAKFGPVQNLNATMAKRSVEITWKRPAILLFDKAFEYKLVMESDNGLQTFEEYISDSHSPMEKINIDGLIPYTNYTISVWSKLMEAVGDLYWSNVSRIVMSTLPDVPEHAVGMTTGSYMVKECGTGICVFLYWKNPAARYLNGQVVGYDIGKYHGTLIVESRVVSRQRLVTVLPADVERDRTGLKASLKLNTPISKSQEYLLTVSLVNTVGPSENVTDIRIPAWNKVQDLKTDWVAVEMFESFVNVSWEVDKHICAKIRSVTVYWCVAESGNSSLGLCKENLNWQTLQETDCCVEKRIKLSRNSEMAGLQYGVSIATSEMSSGIHWENYRFEKPYEVPEIPKFTVQADERALTIFIQNEYHYSKGGRPRFYNVYYTPAEDGQDCKKDGRRKDFPVDFSNREYRVTALESGTSYVICVSANNNAGSSLMGEQRKIKTLDGLLISICP